MKSAINWFEIPVQDLDRATRFYEQVFGITFNAPPPQMPHLALFPMDCSEANITGGALAKLDELKPSMDGTVVYLNAGDDLANPLSRVTPAGGQVLTQKTKINDEVGYYAIFADSEGNRVGMHSPG